MASGGLALPLRGTRLSLGKTARLYWAFARVGFVNTLAYRLRYYTGIVTYFIYVAVYYFIWKAIYEHSQSIEGFNFAQLLTYIGVGWIIRSFYFNNIDQDLAYQVIEGRLAMDLIKPVNIQLMYVARAAGESVFRLALLTVPTAVVLFLVYPLRRPASIGDAAAFLASVGLSFLIVAAINFAVGTFALRLVLPAGTVFRVAAAHDLFPTPGAEDSEFHAVPIHQLYSHADLPGQAAWGRPGARPGDSNTLGRNSAGHRRRPVALVDTEGDYPGRVKEE